MISRVLTEEQIERVHQASLGILERVGVGVPHKRMREMLGGAGAQVDEARERVRIPAVLVQRSLAQCGKQFTLYGRDRSRCARFGQRARNYNSIAGEAMWLDEIGQQRRFPTLQDVATAARFADALEHITIAGAMADPHELPVNWRCVAVAAAMLKHTRKPVAFWFHDRASARYLVDMAIAVRGNAGEAEQYPLFHPFFEPISPLRFPFNGIDLLFETARIAMPVPIGPMAQMGLSAPGTLAGTMAQENAEILAGICITQSIRPGMPVCYGGICHAFDMRTTQMIFCGPEQAILGVAMTQMGKHYGLPVYVNVWLTDSKRPDAQAGMESALTLSHAAAAGADIFGHMGICGVDQATSLDMLVLQHEAISYVESVMREVDFSDEAFGLDVVAEVGPGGSFIDQEHTAAHWRKELWRPELLDRDYYQAWLDKGRLSMEDRCRERKRHILSTHTPEPISDELAKALDGIVQAAQLELGAK